MKVWVRVAEDDALGDGDIILWFHNGASWVYGTSNGMLVAEWLDRVEGWEPSSRHFTVFK